MLATALLDVRQFLRSTAGAIAAVTVAALLGLHFLLIGGAGILDFVLFTYAWLPLLVLPLAAATFGWERHTRFADLVLTTPTSASAYFWRRFLSTLLLGLLLVAATLPFVALVGWLAGPAWVPLLLQHAALACVAVVLAAGIGTFVGVALPPRASLAGVLLASVLVLVLAGWPLVGHALAPRGGTSPLLRLLGLSPSFLVANAGGFVSRAASPAPAEILVKALAFAAGLVALSAFAFSRLQSAESWDTPRPRVLVFGLAALVVVGGVAAAGADVRLSAQSPGFYYDAPASEELGVSYRVTFVTPEGGRPEVGASYDRPLRVTFLREGSGSVVLRDVTLELSGSDLAFEPSTLRLGEVTVSTGETVLVPEVRARVVNGGAPFGGTSRFQHDLQSDAYDATGLAVVQTRPPTDAPQLAVLLTGAALVAVVLGPRLLRRWSPW